MAEKNFEQLMNDFKRSASLLEEGAKEAEKRAEEASKIANVSKEIISIYNKRLALLEQQRAQATRNAQLATSKVSHAEKKLNIATRRLAEAEKKLADTVILKEQAEAAAREAQQKFEQSIEQINEVKLDLEKATSLRDGHYEKIIQTIFKKPQEQLLSKIELESSKSVKDSGRRTVMAAVASILVTSFVSLIISTFFADQSSQEIQSRMNQNISLLVAEINEARNHFQKQKEQIEGSIEDLSQETINKTNGLAGSQNALANKMDALSEDLVSNGENFNNKLEEMRTDELSSLLDEIDRLDIRLQNAEKNAQSSRGLQRKLYTKKSSMLTSLVRENHNLITGNSTLLENLDERSDGLEKGGLKSRFQEIKTQITVTSEQIQAIEDRQNALLASQEEKIETMLSPLKEAENCINTINTVSTIIEDTCRHSPTVN